VVTKLRFSEVEPERNLLRLDLGSGKGGKVPQGWEPGQYVRVDRVKHKEVDRVVDLAERSASFTNSADRNAPHGGRFKAWPWKANSVDEVWADYLVHYLTASERVHFANELYRVLKPGARCSVIVPHWAAAKAYGDVRVQWPPVSEMWFHTLNKQWREQQNCADESGYTCDFDCTVGYGLHPGIIGRNTEYQQNAVTFWKEACQDIIGALVKTQRNTLQ
jgi:SAM-dependent methyltransferase